MVNMVHNMSSENKKIQYHKINFIQISQIFQVGWP